MVTSFQSFLTDEPSKEYIEALEASEIILISKIDLQNIFDASHSFERLGRKLAEFNYLLALKRIESLQTDSATDRYNSFLEVYPGLINQIPHHYVASWLGITPESLSRVRKGSL